MHLTSEIKSTMRASLALRRVPESRIQTLLPRPSVPRSGDVVLARLEKIGKNTRLELTTGRTCSLREGDLLALAFGNRYATLQFEAYAQCNGEFCDLLSMGGVCGLVRSKCDGVPDPSKLRLLGALGDAEGRPLNLQEFALPPAVPPVRRPFVIVVCGSSMDSGKTHTVASLVVGLRRQHPAVAAIKLTGTATGRDMWKVMDAGASPVFDFVDGGYPSTYLCTLPDLLELNRRLVAHAASKAARWVVIEIADGLLQKETAALIDSAGFRSTVDAWVFATNDPLGAAGGIAVLRMRDIHPVAVSGIVSMSPLAMREVGASTGLTCATAPQLEAGFLNERLLEMAGKRDW